MNNDDPSPYRGPSAKTVGRILIVGVFLLIAGLTIYTFMPSKNNGNSTANVNAPHTAPEPSEEIANDIIFNTNDDIVVDNVKIEVGDITTSNEIKSLFNNKTTENQFVLISLTLTNVGDTPTNVFGSRFELIDTEGKLYEANDSSFYSKEDDILYRYTLNPSLSITKKVAFETPKGVESSKLMVYNEEQFLEDAKTFILLK